jgi:hypothetical protein
MELSGSLSVWSRRVVVAVGLAAFVSAASVVGLMADRSAAPLMLPGSAQDPPDQMVLQSDTGLIYFFIVPTHTQDFELTLGKVKDVLAKSTNPEKQKQASGWRTFKLPTPDANGNITYVSFLDPVAKGQTYDLFRILGDEKEGLPYDDARALYDKLSPGFKGANPISLAEIKSGMMN